ncbi:MULTISPECIES: hypothetical protein [Flammeovirga]|uniref:hypothetical protein n=1 Tax=Flammeovirga TaxID=59739 RepID=UPI00080627FD|nr:MULTISPECIES: hypothetical protein [Flammeovirga]ANQ48598.1 hypothetical protein MY04_1221 [Flammeovirga sp. MY04]MBB3696487.1 hypothetical protein [Flammeovirga yaeyamensis]NMF33168.1 hypothetical protein [Flammeovirga yaeyamensis]
MEKRYIEVEIDKLTNSIENVITGDSFNTQVLPITSSDIEKLNQGWNFDWKAENNSSSKVFKLVIENNVNIIQGLISLSYHDGFVFVELIESADFNIGRNKVYFGVAGNLFAFACKESWDQGDYGYVAFNSKTNLIPHYNKTLGAKQVGQSNQMVIEPEDAVKLLNKYYG